MSVGIRSGPARIVASGMVTAFWAHELVFEVALGEVPFTVTLGWASDAEVDGVEVRTTWPSGGIRFDLVNFDDSEGRGTAEPVLLTDVGDEAIFLHFRVFCFGQTTDRTVHYTFYGVDKHAIGWTPVVQDGDGG